MLNVTSTSTPYTVETSQYVKVDEATQTVDGFNILNYTASGTVGVALSESARTETKFVVARAESVKAAEARIMKSATHMAETLRFDENAGKNLAITRIGGVVKASGTGARGIGARKTEPVALSESLAKSASMIKRAGARFTENAYRGVTLPRAEAATLTEAVPVWNMAAVRKDGATISETVKKGAGKPLAESVRFSDVRRLNATANRQESLSIAIAQGRQYYITAGALLEASEYYRKRIGSAHSEAATAGEDYWRGMESVTKYGLSLVESLNRTADFNRRYAERMNTAESPYKEISPKYGEYLQTAEFEYAEIGKNETESVNYGISNRTSWEAKANLIEAFTLSEIIPKEVEAVYRGGLTADMVRVLNNPGGILSDIYVGKSGITLAEFEDMAAKPAEYTPFTEFKVGEYEYQDAMYRMVIRKDNTAANPLVYGYAVHVDIDDVKDRGTAPIKAEETKVYFNRTYYTTPDVVVNVVGGLEGETVTPVITGEGVDDAGRYFTVVLKNSSGTAVAGTITWNSNGY